MSRKASLWIGGVVAAALLFVVVVLVIDATREETIGDGVRIGTVDVSGLDRLEALERVRSELGPRATAEVRVTHGSRSFVLTPAQAEAALDVRGTVAEALRRSQDGTNPFTRVLGGHDASGTIPARVVLSRPAVDRFAVRVAETIDRKARDADIEWREGKLRQTRERTGVTTRRAALADAVAQRLQQPDRPRTVSVPVEAGEEPETTIADLRDRYPTVITVDRDGKRLRLYKDLKLDRTYPVAVGKEGNETTPGRYAIQSKQVDPVWNVPQSDWAGSLAGQTIPAGDPRNPLVARWMGFNGSQGIHGTDDLASLGSTASHGCIRMAEEDVTALYDEVKTKTPVFVQ